MLNRETRSHVFLYLTYMLLFLRSSVYFPETALAQASQRELEKVRLRERFIRSLECIWKLCPLKTADRENTQISNVSRAYLHRRKLATETKRENWKPGRRENVLKPRTYTNTDPHSTCRHLTQCCAYQSLLTLKVNQSVERHHKTTG